MDNFVSPFEKCGRRTLHQMIKVNVRNFSLKIECTSITEGPRLTQILGLEKTSVTRNLKCFFYLNVVAIAGIGLRVVDLVVDGLKGGLEGFSIGLLSSINASSVSSSSTNSALKLK